MLLQLCLNPNIEYQVVINLTVLSPLRPRVMSHSLIADGSEAGWNGCKWAFLLDVCCHCFQRADFIVWVKTFKITQKSLKSGRLNSEKTQLFITGLSMCYLDGSIFSWINVHVNVSMISFSEPSDSSIQHHSCRGRSAGDWLGFLCLREAAWRSSPSPPTSPVMKHSRNVRKKIG